jgi:hypothetical protein
VAYPSPKVGLQPLQMQQRLVASWETVALALAE